jgi:hypothetical protein
MLGLYRRFMDLDYVYASLLKYILDRKLSKKEKKNSFSQRLKTEKLIITRLKFQGQLRTCN